MANRTVKEATSVKGTNPQFLVEKIIRQRIYDNLFWKEQCFALTAELIVDKGMELRYLGGIYAGNIKPTPFLCLLLKMLQIQPEKDIAIEFIKQTDFKYLRCLGAMFIRLTCPSTECFRLLEPLYNDYRKVRWMNKMGKFELLHMDDFIDSLLHAERVCDIQLPRLQKREALEEVGELEAYSSLLDEDLEKLSSDESEEEDDRDKKKERPKLVNRRRDRSKERELQERERRGSPVDRRKRSRSRERGDKDVRKERGGERSERDRRDDRRDDGRREDRGRDERGGRDDRGRDGGRDGRRGGDERSDRRGGRDDDRRRDRSRDRGRGDDRKRKGNDEETEIAEANALRASLGLKPLESITETGITVARSSGGGFPVAPGVVLSKEALVPKEFGLPVDELYRVAVKFYREKEQSGDLTVSYDERLKCMALSEQVRHGPYDDSQNDAGRSAYKRYVSIVKIVRFHGVQKPWDENSLSSPFARWLSLHASLAIDGVSSVRNEAAASDEGVCRDSEPIGYFVISMLNLGMDDGNCDLSTTAATSTTATPAGEESDIVVPSLPPRDEKLTAREKIRIILKDGEEEVGELEGYSSLLDEDLEKLSSDESEEEDDRDKKKGRPKLVNRRRDRSKEREMQIRERRGSPVDRRKRSRRRERGDKDVRKERGGERSECDRRDDRRDDGRREDRGRDERGGRDDRGRDGGRDGRRGGDERSDRRGGRDDDRRRHRSRDRGRGDDRKREGNDEETEIAEANALRASLGLKPLER